MHPFLWRAIRKKFRTQYAFAAHIGVSTGWVSLIVNGVHKLDDKEKSRWAEALDSTVEELFGDGAPAQKIKHVAMA
jgi:plasmid maintenance system antidote protein VapI